MFDGLGSIQTIPNRSQATSWQYRGDVRWLRYRRSGRVGQIQIRNLSRLAAMPSVSLAGVLMHTESDKLLVLGKHFNFLTFVAVRRDQADADVFERLVGAKYNRALRRLTKAHEKMSLLFKPLAGECLARFSCILIENVEVQRRHQSRQQARALCVRV